MRVERLMRHNGIRARTPRRFLVRTTNSHHALPIAANRLDQTFAAGRPNQVWPGPHHLRANRGGWLYLAVVRDLFTRKIAGWAMRGHMQAELTIAAPAMAIKRQEPPPSLTHHSDRGRQYAAAGYRKVHDAAGMIQSMRRKGKLGQRTGGKQLRHFENRTRAPGLRQNPGCRPARLVRLYRRILQS